MLSSLPSRNKSNAIMNELEENAGFQALLADGIIQIDELVKAAWFQKAVLDKKAIVPRTQILLNPVMQELLRDGRVELAQFDRCTPSHLEQLVSDSSIVNLIKKGGITFENFIDCHPNDFEEMLEKGSFTKPSTSAVCR